MLDCLGNHEMWKFFYFTFRAIKPHLINLFLNLKNSINMNFSKNSLKSIKINKKRK